ncbi:formylglycine-generating enzyme family protein [Myxococcota bacterium]|nr:formylglycine-generating enzyme family protein [Myxococcota bacterium]
MKRVLYPLGMIMMAWAGPGWGQESQDDLKAQLEQIQGRLDLEASFLRQMWELEGSWTTARVQVASGANNARAVLQAFIDRWQAKKIPNRHEAEAKALIAALDQLDADWAKARPAIEAGGAGALEGFLERWSGASIPNVYAAEARVLALLGAAARREAARDALAAAREAEQEAQLKMLTLGAMEGEWAVALRELNRDPDMGRRALNGFVMRWSGREVARARLIEANSLLGRSLSVWIMIPGGSFQMGSNNGDSDEKPVHEVRLKGFMMSKSEVTVGQYRACVNAGVCTAPSTGGECNWGQSARELYPINCVDWSQAQTFAKWALARLPTEAEWEYAARSGGRNQEYPWGNGAPSCERAQYSGCGGATLAVCSRLAGNSVQGLCDMSGNVWEWVADWYASDYNSTPRDGTEHLSGGARVFRGGGWNVSASYLRAAARYGYNPSVLFDDLGFRLARSLP